MASLNAANEYLNLQLSADYDAANQRYTEALLAGMDETKALHEMDAAYEKANKRHTEALMNLTRDDDYADNLDAALANDAVSVATPENPTHAVARLADENEQNNCNFVVVAEAVE